MKVLFYNETKDSVAPYFAELVKMGIQAEERRLPFPAEWVKKPHKDLSLDFIRKLTAYVTERDGAAVDVIQILFTTKEWGMASAVKGKQWHSSFNNLQIAIAREQKNGWIPTARHELWHSFDNICWLYNGINLAAIVGVPDFDDDVVHRRGPKGGEYLNAYDDFWPTVKPFLFAAIKRRKELAVASLIQRLGLLVRSVTLPAKTESIIEDPDFAMPKPTPAPAPVPAPKPTAIVPTLLERAIMRVESANAQYPEGYDRAIGDLHLTHKAYGPMQIRKVYITDANQVLGTNYKAEDCLGNRELSIKIFRAYMSRYAKRSVLGFEPTDETIARIHNGGPTGWKRSTTEGYWLKVRKQLALLKA